MFSILASSDDNEFFTFMLKHTIYDFIRIITNDVMLPLVNMFVNLEKSSIRYKNIDISKIIKEFVRICIVIILLIFILK